MWECIFKIRRFPLRRKIHTGVGTGDVSSNITLRLIRCTSQIISMKSGWFKLIQTPDIKWVKHVSEKKMRPCTIGRAGKWSLETYFWNLYNLQYAKYIKRLKPITYQGLLVHILIKQGLRKEISYGIFFSPL